MKGKYLLSALIGAGLASLTASASAQSNVTIPDSWTKEFQWRSIGPAGMGGRTTAICVDPTDSSTYYIGFATAGVAKTTNNGITFSMIFEHEAVSGVGCIDVAPSNPNVIYVGTGEANPRNSVNYGNGVYKSTDGGKTWAHMGLPGSFQIGKIRIDPKNENVVYVGVMGRLWGPSKERGLYKTTDGGKTWNQVLFVNDQTGVIDIAMNPKNPNMLLAATWEHQRDGFDAWRGDPPIEDGYDAYDPKIKWGPGGGIWKSTDAGKTWRRLTRNLPTSQIGRVGFDIYQKDPNVVFAVIDCRDIGRGEAPPKITAGFEAKTTPKGFEVTSVVTRGPADVAEIKVGDVITSVDGKPAKSMKDFYNLLRTKKADDKLAVSRMRDGAKADVTITLATRLGAGLGPSVRQIYGLDLSTDLVPIKIDTVRPGRLAATAGLKSGDVIVKVNGREVKVANDMVEALDGVAKDKSVEIVVNREGKDVTLSFKMPEVEGLNKQARAYGFMYGGQQPNIQDLQGDNGELYGGIYRSGDFGESWTRVNSLNPRPMYFSQVRVDPQDEKYVYLAGVNMYRSVDGGVTFTGDASNSVHADQHALWIDPKDGRHMIVGCDGGFYVSYDRTATWLHLNNLALGQFYHVAVDNRMPYWAYGGLQDNGSWAGPSMVRGARGPFNESWLSLSGGDGFVCHVNTDSPNLIYSESQDGNIVRTDTNTGGSVGIRPRPEPGLQYRFNWNTPFMLSWHNQSVFYSAGNYVFKSVRNGDDLRRISPEISRTSRGTGTAFSESPLNPNILWAGTDDGNVWVTQDGGNTWNEVSAAFGLKSPLWVGTIEASRFAEGRAYVCFTAHRQNDDAPYLFVTEDFGKTWRNITANMPTFGTSRCLREDPINQNLLYCGTEFGIFASIDRGASWTSIKSQLPTVPVYEIAIHPTAGDAIIATHGRSVWVTDVSALRQLNAGALGAAVTLYDPKPAINWKRELEPAYGDGDFKFFGENPRRGTPIWYSITGDVKSAQIQIKDIAGRVLRRYQNIATDKGMHVLYWDATGQPAGNYTVTLVADEKEYSKPVQVILDPDLVKVGLPAAPPVASTDDDDEDGGGRHKRS